MSLLFCANQPVVNFKTQLLRESCKFWMDLKLYLWKDNLRFLYLQHCYLSQHARRIRCFCFWRVFFSSFMPILTQAISLSLPNAFLVHIFRKASYFSIFSLLYWNLYCISNPNVLACFEKNTFTTNQAAIGTHRAPRCKQNECAFYPGGPLQLVTSHLHSQTFLLCIIYVDLLYITIYNP